MSTKKRVNIVNFLHFLRNLRIWSIFSTKYMPTHLFFCIRVAIFEPKLIHGRSFFSRNTALTRKSEYAKNAPRVGQLKTSGVILKGMIGGRFVALLFVCIGTSTK